MRLHEPMTDDISAVIFDLAGTTVDYGSLAPAEAFVELFARHGVRITVEEARGPMGTHKRDHIQALLDTPRIAGEWRAAEGGEPTEEVLSALYAEFIPLQVACLDRYSDLIPGTLKALDLIRDMGACIGVTTGYNREMLDIVLQAAGRQGFVPDAAICAEDVREGRPAPWMLFRAMEQLGTYPPPLVVAVGDTIPDIQAGLNAGVWTIGVTKTGNMLGLGRAATEALDPAELRDRLGRAERRMKAAGAHAVVDSINECPAAVEQIRDRLAAGERPR